MAQERLMDGVSWVMQVHALAMEHPIVLHAVLKRKYVYFNAYGITWTHMAKIKINDMLDGKITPVEVMKEIEETYHREVKNAPKNHSNGERKPAEVCS